MTDPSPDSPPPRTTGGNWRWEPPSPSELEAMLPGYSIEKLLGRGGMGAVYKGIQTNLDRTVAIKILPDGIGKEDFGYAERFRNEAKVMARLLHPAIVAVFDFGETPAGQLYFVMEYVDGSDVQAMLSGRTRLPAEHAHAVAAHVCDALAAAHGLGIVHRDIKPANVLINLQGQVKVADFGLAKFEEPGRQGLTQTGMALGTPDYVAPEALVLGAEVDARADLYALGVMLYTMLTGELPRGAWKSPSEKVPGLDPRFDDIVDRAMQVYPEDRYQSALELRRDLDVIVTVPIVKKDGSQSAALPQQAVTDAPGRRSAAARVPARGRRTGISSAPVSASSVSPSRKRAMLLGASLALATLVGVGLYFLFASKTEDIDSNLLQAAANSAQLAPHDGEKSSPTGSNPSPASSQLVSRTAAPVEEGTPEEAEANGEPKTPLDPPTVEIASTETAGQISKEMVPSAAPSLAEESAENSAPTKTIPAEAKPFGGHHYLFVPGKLSWPEAKARAEAMGGHLAVITSQEEDDFAKSLLGSALEAYHALCWIGASEDTPQATWSWVNSEPFEYTGWGEGEPNRDRGRAEVTHPFWVGYFQGGGESGIGWNDAAPNDGNWQKQIVGFLVEWSGSSTASPNPPTLTQTPNPPPSSSAPDLIKAQLAADLLAEAKARGGTLRALGHGPNGPFDVGDAAEFDDFVQVSASHHGWSARRAGGGVHAGSWGTSGSQPYVPLGPFETTYLSRAALINMILSDGSSRNVWSNDSQPNGSKPPGADRIIAVMNHMIRLESAGKQHWVYGSANPARPDFFTNATSITGTYDYFVRHRPGEPVQSWIPKNGPEFTFPDQTRETAAMDGGHDHVVLLDAKGKVQVWNADGTAPAPDSPLLKNLPNDPNSFVAVRAGKGMSAAQRQDGTWVAWGASESLAAEVASLGMALDLDLYHDEKASFAMWIEPPAGTADLTRAATLPEDVAERLAAIDAQFQAAYDRDIAPPHLAAVTDLDTKYAAAVRRALEAATQGGHLDEAVALREETQRLTEKSALPASEPASSPESLVKLRTTYRDAIAKLEADRLAKAKPYFDRHDQLLDAYQRELTQENRIDDALLVKQHRDRVAASRSSPDPVPRVSSPPPSSTAAAAATAPAPASSASSSANSLAASDPLDPGHDLSKLPPWLQDAAKSGGKLRVW